MLTANLALDDATGDEVAFNLQSYLPDGARRIDIATSNPDERTLTIQHTASGKGTAVVNRHLISAKLSKVSEAGVPSLATVNLTIAMPKNNGIANADIHDLVSVIVDLVTDGGFSGSGLAGTTALAAILRGES
jgi:hypothetical protein